MINSIGLDIRSKYLPPSFLNKSVDSNVPVQTEEKKTSDVDSSKKETKPKTIVNGERKTPHKRKKHKNELLDSKPIYISSYANELGAALAPLPGIGNKLFLMSWVPTLMYLGADVNSKYEEARDNKAYNPCKTNAIEFVIFEEVASSLLSTAVVILGQKAASRLSRVMSNDKMDVRAKEDVIKELRRELNQQKIMGYKDKISNVLSDKKMTDIDKIRQTDEIKKIKNDLTESIFADIKAESQNYNRHKKNIGPLRRIFEYFTSSQRDCKNVSRINDDNFDKLVKPYLSKQISSLVDSRIELQRILNPDGSFNKSLEGVDEDLLKLSKKLLKRADGNRNITDKFGYVLQEHSMKKLNTAAHKLSLVKIAGGIAALALCAIPIDKFISVIFTPKGVQFDMEKIKKTFPAFDLNIKLQ